MLLTLSIAAAAPWALERPPTVVVAAGSTQRARFRTSGSLAVGLVLDRGRWHDLLLSAVVDAPSLYLFQPGFQRTHASASLSLEPLWVVNPWLALGPMVAGTVRSFDQAGELQRVYGLPQAGATFRLHLARAPGWRLALHAQVVADLVQTDLLLGTATVNRFSPVGLRTWVSMAFGQDRRENG